MDNILKCPRRGEHPFHDYGQDTWRTGEQRWSGDDSFPEGCVKPSTCSFCGGAHPGDIIALLQSGWRLSSTTKNYKWYVVLPGYAISPPVKLYTQHFSDEQLNTVNALLSVWYNTAKAEMDKKTSYVPTETPVEDAVTETITEPVAGLRSLEHHEELMAQKHLSWGAEVVNTGIACPHCQKELTFRRSSMYNINSRPIAHTQCSCGADLTFTWLY